jgi:predicted O-methyltransferase YrrM
MTTYKYTQRWFINSDVNRLLPQFLNPDDTHTILEIGCFEGLSSTFFADIFLKNPDSSLTCVDPFLSIPNNDHSQFLQNNEERNFDYNISVCKHSDKITVHKVTSDQFFQGNRKMYNFIYIDGCHDPDYIKRDITNAFSYLENGGILWMDDYEGGDGIQIKNAMNEMLEYFKGQYVVIHRGYQLAIRKY